MLPFLAVLMPNVACAQKAPDDLIEVVAFLRAHGLGDSRGGTYRVFRGNRANSYGWDSTQESLGWSFPNGRFVTNDGLTYIGIKRTKPADLEADVMKEASSLPHRNGLPPEGDEIQGRLRAAVLLAMGRPDLAKRLLSASPPYDARTSNLATIQTFVTRRYEQAVTAHLAADDREAQRAEEGLVAAAEAYARIDDPPDHHPWWELATMRTLTADTERRLASARVARPRGPARRLIAELQDVRVRQYGLPGRAQFVDSPIVRRLIALGDRAVDPLLDCVACDQRLTRTASFGQSLVPTVETVETAARTALFALLDIPVFDASAESGVVPVERLRAWWRAHRGETRPTRQVAVLADGARGPIAWDVAAERLFGSQKLPHLFEAPEPVGQGLRPPLREVQTAALANLLVTRARDFEVERPGFTQGFGVYKAARLAAMLTFLDRPRGLDLLRETTRKAGDLILVHPGEFQATEVVGSGFAFRADHGDPTAWADYREWLRRARAKPLRGFWVFHQFRPLVERRREPALRGAAEEMFGPDSPWDPLTMAKAGKRPEEMLHSTLLNVPEIQRGVLELLRDRTECATLTVGERYAEFRRDDGTEGTNYTLPWPAMPPKGTVRRIRYADLLADRLRGLRNMPDFQIGWPVSRRDEALVRMVRIVERGGEIYRFRR